MVYDDNDCNQYISQLDNNDYLKVIYHQLIPGAYKADLWRLLVLYEYGGIYIYRCWIKISDKFRRYF